MYDKYIDEFMPSEELRVWLKTQELRPWEITNLIFFSPVPLTKKKPALQALLKEALVMNNKELADECSTFLHDLDLAEKILAEDGVFTIESYGYDSDKDDSSNYLASVCDTFEQAKELVKENWNENESKPDDTDWHEVTKWIRRGGKYKEACHYIFIEKEACLIEPAYYMRDDFIYNTFYGIDLRLTLPYQPGDILEIDCRPFKEKAVVIVGWNLYPDDCCSPQVLSKGKDGKWTFGAIKHGHLFNWHLDQGISALYRLKKLQNFVPETDDDRLILAVKEFIDQCEDKDKLYNETSFKRYTTEEFTDALGRLKNHQALL